MSDNSPFGKGRPKGRTNLMQREAKDYVLTTFINLGGVKAMLEWALENKGDFYTKIFTKLIPLQVKADMAMKWTDMISEAEERANTLRKPPDGPTIN